MYPVSRIPITSKNRSQEQQFFSISTGREKNAIWGKSENEYLFIMYHHSVIIPDLFPVHEFVFVFEVVKLKEVKLREGFLVLSLVRPFAVLFHRSRT